MIELTTSSSIVCLGGDEMSFGPTTIGKDKMGKFAINMCCFRSSIAMDKSLVR